jgi:predicted nucleotidyltransferase
LHPPSRAQLHILSREFLELAPTWRDAVCDPVPCELLFVRDPCGIVRTQRLLNSSRPVHMSTPSSIDGPSTLAAYAAGWRVRERVQAATAAAWRTRIAQRLPRVAKMLVDDFGATRVLLFGSVARGDAGPDSDVDLLVEGLALDRLIEATVRAGRLLEEATADLVPADRVRPEVGARAESEGIDLHGR